MCATYPKYVNAPLKGKKTSFCFVGKKKENKTLETNIQIPDQIPVVEEIFTIG